METMTGRNVVLAVSGGIAAYKSAELVRLLVRQGYEVRVVMTRGAEAFIQPMTFQALSGHPVRQSLLDPEAEAGMGHIELARWADLVLVAPATADVMAKLAVGLADDLLTTLALATDAPIALAPAMNQAMWRNPRTQRNLQWLQNDPQFHIWGPAEGDQACGDTGPGRMLEPDAIMEQVVALADQSLAGLRVVLTAGPTREALDPVRYISNHSSGKMGFAIAEAAAQRGAEVVLVAGPVNLPTPAGVRRVDVDSAAEMLDAVEKAVEAGCDWFIATAAVADYRPVNCAEQKIKKDGEASPTLELARNPDILATVASHRQRPMTIGFAAETSNLAEYARRKLHGKKLDLIVANDVSDRSIGFNSDRNAVEVFWDGDSRTFASMEKVRLAGELVALFHEHWSAQYQAQQRK